MAKNVASKTWSLTVDPIDGKKYSGPPADVTAPTVPQCTVLSVTSDSLTVRVSTASTDAQSGLQDYIFSIAPVSTGVYVDQTPVSPSIAESAGGATFDGLSASTAYNVKVKARDLNPVPNISAFGTAKSATTSAVPTNDTWFPNWPIMNVCNCQGDILQNLMNTTWRDFCGEKDVFMFQWFYPTNSRLSSRSSACSYIKTNYPGCKLIMYTEVFETIKNLPDPPQNNAMEILKNTIDGVNGNSNWYLETTSNQRTECRFSPPTQWQVNGAVLVSGLNSSGKRMDQQYYQDLWALFNGGSPANFASTYLDGLFVDNFEAKHPTLTINNGANSVTNTADMNNDGVVDVRNNYTSGQSNAGGLFWAQGGLAIKATIESVIGANRVVYPNAARWTYDYFDGSGSNPPLPLSAHPYYGKWEMIMKETVSNDFGFTIDNTADVYSFNGGGGADLAFRRMTMQEKFLKPTDVGAVAGKHIVCLEARCVNRTTLTADDYTYSRFMLGCALLMSRVAFSVNVGAVRPMPLDELFYDLGNPIGNRTMGTLNEATLAWTLRTPDLINGAGRFYWARFERGIVVVRLDSPTVGAYPSADAAVSCTLPAAGSGKKWQFINSATYVSPAKYKGVGGAAVTRAMRGQNTSLNNGADTTTVSLKPFHAAIIRLVNGP